MILTLGSRLSGRCVEHNKVHCMAGPNTEGEVDYNQAVEVDQRQGVP